MNAAFVLIATLSVATAPATACQPLPVARQWLDQQLPHWQAVLAHEPGYRPPSHLQICALHGPRPYADMKHQRIYAAPLRSSNDTVSLVHEYLHLALAGHPHGHDEAYVEALAERLVRLGVAP